MAKNYRVTKARILIIENSIDVTGSLNAALRVALALRDTYDFVFALPIASRAVSVVEQYEIETCQVPMQEISKRWRSIIFYIPNLAISIYHIRKIVVAKNISIIHVNDFYNMIMPIWKLGGAKVRYLVYVNFVPDRFPIILRKTWITFHLLFSHRIVAVSQYVLRQLPARKKITCIPDALPAQGGLTPFNHNRAKIFLFVGNFIMGKGQDLAIRAFASLTLKHPVWKLRFVGGDMGLEKNRQYKLSLKALAEKLTVGDKIEWVDFSLNVKEEYERASIALNFSVSESFSLTVQEAMFYGCPVIATNSGGPSELIDNNHSGLLVPVNDVSLMAVAMENLILNETKRSELAMNARKTICEKFARSKTIDLLDNVYRCMINRKDNT